MTTDEARKMMLSCFKNALDEVTTTCNIQGSFHASGIVLVDKNVPLANQFVFDNNKLYDNGSTSFVNNKCLNINKESLKELFRYDFKREGSDAELQLTLQGVKKHVKDFHKKPLTSGRLLTQVPDLIIEHDGMIERIKLEE